MLKNVTTLFVMLMFPGIGWTLDCESATSSVDDLIERSTRIVLAEAKATSRDLAPIINRQPPELVLDPDVERRKMTEGVSSDRANPEVRISMFTVTEELRGTGQDSVYRPNSDATWDQHDFDRHRDQVFWTDVSAGNVRLGPNCIPDMHFEPGKTYLLFEGPTHVKAAELIEAEDDAWLAYVRERL